MQLAFWVDVQLAKRFIGHCAAVDRFQREVAEEAFAFYLDNHPRAAAPVDGAFPLRAPSSVRGSDSHDGAKE
jgi:hypothetical protein